MSRGWLLFVIPVFIYGGYMSLPRGIRNNNPGNIRHGDNWQGMKDVQTDNEYVQFKSAKYGIRAMAKILETYRKNGVEYLVDIIYRWAPPTENNTRAYIEHVEKQTGIFGNQKVLKSDYPKLIAAMIKHENGFNPYPISKIQEGIALA